MGFAGCFCIVLSSMFVLVCAVTVLHYFVVSLKMMGARPLLNLILCSSQLRPPGIRQVDQLSVEKHSLVSNDPKKNMSFSSRMGAILSPYSKNERNTNIMKL